MSNYQTTAAQLDALERSRRMEEHGRDTHRRPMDERLAAANRAENDLYKVRDIREAMSIALGEADVARRWGVAPTAEQIIEVTVEKLRQKSELLKPGPGEDSDDYK